MAGFDDSLTLLVIGADAALRERLGAFVFSGRMEFLEKPPSDRAAGAVALLPLPSGVREVSFLPVGLPFIAVGGPDQVGAAYDLGAADFLREPWPDEELRRRAERLGTGGFAVPEAGLRVAAGWLYGPDGSVALSAPERFLLAELCREMGRRVSRSAVRRYLGVSRAVESRAVDVLVSRLRRRIDRVAGAGTRVQIRALRGFGYYATLIQPL
jgi:hypothetical protein